MNSVHEFVAKCICINMRTKALWKRMYRYRNNIISSDYFGTPKAAAITINSIIAL